MAGERSYARYVLGLRLITAGALAPLLVAVFHFATPLGPGAAPVASAVTAALLLVPLSARVDFGFRDARRPRAARSVVLAYDLLWMTTLLAPVTTALAALALFASHKGSLTRACVYGVAAAAIVAAYGVFVRRRWFVRRRTEIPIPDLPRSLDGYRIVHVSDLHIGSIDGRDQALEWARAASALEPDLIVVTGDILTTGTAYHAEAVEALSELRARDGVYACLGNHDYYDEDALCRALAERSVRVLRNEGVALGDLFVAGLEDIWRGRPDLSAALRDRGERPTLLLAHNPETFPAAVAASVPLTLAGHTHAGQLAVPFLVARATLSRWTTRWPAGLYREGDAHLFVNAGLGTTGPAIRLGAAPEVVEIVLRRE